VRPFRHPARIPEKLLQDVFDRQLGQQKVVRLEVSDELGLGRKDEEKGGAFGPDSRGSTDAVDVVGVGGRRVVLQYPVDLEAKIKQYYNREHDLTHPIIIWEGVGTSTIRTSTGQKFQNVEMVFLVDQNVEIRTSKMSFELIRTTTIRTSKIALKIKN
jgi:hypothetical protein